MPENVNVVIEPIVFWGEGSLALKDEVKDVINYGTVEAGSDSNTKKFFIMNNRNGETDVPKMENVTFTTRDRQGGLGNTPGSEVEAVKDSWFMVKVDSLGEASFTEVGAGGSSSSNPTGEKALGTNGETTSRWKEDAVTWGETQHYNVGQFIKPTAGVTDFVYQVVLEGTTGSTEPTWNLSEGGNTMDGTVTYRTYKVVQKPKAQELLGIANKVNPDGSGAENAAGNFAEITVYAEVPDDATSGVNKLLFRVNYQYV